MDKITIGKATLINMDCMDYMKTLPDNHYCLAICDPPYGIGFDNKIMDKNIKNWDSSSSRGVKRSLWRNYV